MKIKYLPLLLLAVVGFQTAGCGQTNVKSQSNENKTTVNKTAQTKTTPPEEVKIPAGVKHSVYEGTPPQDSLLLTLRGDKQLYYQNKSINASALKNVLKEAAAKTKKLSKTKEPSYLLDDEKTNRIYLKADAGAPFSEVIKILKMVQESSLNEYRAKFIVNPAEEVGGYAKTPNGRSTISVDLGLPAKPDAYPKPNPLILVARLDAAGKIKLNNEPPMEIGKLKTLLTKIFDERGKNGVFAEGTNEVAREIILVTDAEVKYGDVTKLIDELREIYVNSVVFGELSDNYRSAPMEPPPPM